MIAVLDQGLVTIRDNQEQICTPAPVRVFSRCLEIPEIVFLLSHLRQQEVLGVCRRGDQIHC